MKVIQTIGNKELWQRKKTLFICSKRAPIGTWGKVFDWVDSLTNNDTVVCFDSSDFEAEVLKALLVNKIPTVLVVMNRFLDIYNVQIELALKENRLLIMELKRDEPQGKGSTPFLRNRFIINQVNSVVCGYVSRFGSVVLLLEETNNIEYLIGKKDLNMAAEPTEKPFHWTVGEDKRLLRMFYEDMGIHAIHKAINRPYSTIYLHIKSLTMNDEVLKGREFENYVVDLFDLPNNKKLTLKEWRSDKSLPGVYPESNSAPDFVFEYDGRPFAVECKWRSHLPKDIEKELLPTERMASFQQFSTDRCMPVYLLLGIGGLPNDPDNLYFTHLDKDFSLETLVNSVIPSKNCLMEKIGGLFVTAKHSNHIQEQKALYSNAYKPWSKDDNALLTKLYKEGTSIKELMSLFQRNRGGITSRLRKLGFN